MKSTAKVWWVIGLLILAVAIGATWLYASRHNAAKPTLSATPTVAASASVSPSSTARAYTVSVYWSKHPDSDNDPSKTFAVSRTSADLGVGSAAITQLLKGPTAAESAQGYFTTVRLRAGTSTCGGNDFSLSMSGSIATLRFCRPFDHLGVVADGQASSEITATLKQFSSVQKVIILNSQGNCEFDLSGENRCLQ